MNTPMGAGEFWESRSLVSSYAAEATALAYEVDAIRSAVRRSEATAPVGEVHVIGVGAGRELQAICEAAPAAHIRASDISSAMVDACRVLVERSGLERVTVQQRAASDLVRHSSDDPVDVVIGLGAVLGYSTTPEQQRAVLHALAGLLRPGGALALVVQQRYGRPDWAAWFAARAVLDALPGRSVGAGNRWSRHDATAVLFHHYSRSELRTRLHDAGFIDLTVHSLRQWGRAHGIRMPFRSPNPLIAIATFGGRPTSAT